MQRVTRLVFLMILVSAITQSMLSQDILSSGRDVNVKTAPTKPVLTAEQIAQRFLPGVALIICDDGKGNYSQGSGIFIGDGTILTNAHVVKGMVRGVVIAGEQQKKNLIDTIGYFNSENTDLALLHSDEAKTAKKPIAPFAQSNDLRIGETIYVLSNPEGLVGTISQGIVSSGIRKMKNMDLLQISAPISEGSSGGAVLNSRGEVIGLATSTLASGQNLNFAVPVSSIRLFLKQFLEERKNLELVSASQISGSWDIPKLFLSKLENDENKRIPSSVVSDNSQLILKEATTWLSNKLVGKSFVSGKFLNKPGSLLKTERIIFNNCDMYLEQKTPLDTGTNILTYRVNMNSVKEAFIYPIVGNFVSLALSSKTTMTNRHYLSGNYDVNKPDFTSTNTDDTINLATGEQSLEQIQKAFNSVIKLCKESAK